MRTKHDEWRIVAILFYIRDVYIDYTAIIFEQNTLGLVALMPTNVGTSRRRRIPSISDRGLYPVTVMPAERETVSDLP